MAFQLRVQGGGTVGAGKVVAVAKNYEDHRREMDPDVDPGPPGDPVVFLKPSTCLVADGGVVRIPPGVTNVHWETELAVVVGRPMRHVPEPEAFRHVLGYAVFLDMTARDLQAEARRAGLPWSLSKGMDTFGPISDVVPAARVKDPSHLVLCLRVNGEERQRGRTADMIHPVPRILSWVSRFMTLEPGDVVATGTPAGVGPVRPGDVLEASLEGVVSLRVRVEGG